MNAAEKLLFRFDPERVSGVTEVADLTQNGHAAASVVPIFILPPDVVDGRDERSLQVVVPRAAAG